MQLLTEELRTFTSSTLRPRRKPKSHYLRKVLHTRFKLIWFVTEGEADEDDFRFFGNVIGHEEEWGYFLLSELESARGPLRFPIERDLYFQKGLWSEVIARYRQKQGEQT